MPLHFRNELLQQHLLVVHLPASAPLADAVQTRVRVVHHSGVATFRKLAVEIPLHNAGLQRTHLAGLRQFVVRGTEGRSIMVHRCSTPRRPRDAVTASLGIPQQMIVVTIWGAGFLAAEVPLVPSEIPRVLVLRTPSRQIKLLIPHTPH